MSQLILADGTQLAYEHSTGGEPGVLFCPGFNSDMQGEKALFLQRWCQSSGRQYTRFDYSGHGRSDGEFLDGSIGRWSQDALAILDQITQGPQIVVGSSMGGWIMLLLAQRRPERLAGLVGIAAAPDFTQRMQSGLNASQRVALRENGYFLRPSDYGEPYAVGAHLLEEGQNHLLLNGPIAIDLPVRLLHGQSDIDVPWQQALTLADRLSSEDVEVQLIKRGDHRLSSAADLQRLARVIDALCAQVTIDAGCQRAS